MSKYFEIVRTLLETSKVYYSNLDMSEEEVEEPQNELMRVHLAGAFQTLVTMELMKHDVLQQINNLANRAFLEMMRDDFGMPEKKTTKNTNEIKRWMKEDAKGEEPLVISHDALIYYWAIKKNLHLFPADFKV